MSTRSSTSSDIDDAAILSGIWSKNALRRRAGLPLWPVRETFERELDRARWRAHFEANYKATRTQVLAELRDRHGEGFGLSAGGRWVIEALTAAALRASF